jgi:hypothetical protein
MLNLGDETSDRLMKGCQNIPPEIRYKKMLGVWFPGMKAFLAFFAFLLGVAVMSHSILDCEELQGACENYRSHNREECMKEREGPPKANAFDADCQCQHSIVSCYTTEVQDGQTVCVSCEKVAADFVDFLWSTGSLVVILGLLLMMVSVAEVLVVAKNLLNHQSLAVLAFADLGLVGGLVSTVIKKRRIANSISDVCKGEDSDDAMEYAPVTMGNLCHYHWLLTWIVSFCVLLIVVSFLNLCWSLFGAVVGIPVDFEKMDEGDAREPPQTFGSSTEMAARDLELRAPAAASSEAAPGGASSRDIDVEIDESRDQDRM